mmetsp:Transcript_22959/g.71372  ORF Transcript_22959/g.71372 Transcript_22959/m.71372 type:complete len:321 (-) Transcript_22959:215-1177(-)
MRLWQHGHAEAAEQRPDGLAEAQRGAEERAKHVLRRIRRVRGEEPRRQRRLHRWQRRDGLEGHAETEARTCEHRRHPGRFARVPRRRDRAGRAGHHREPHPHDHEAEHHARLRPEPLGLAEHGGQRASHDGVDHRAHSEDAAGAGAVHAEALLHVRRERRVEEAKRCEAEAHGEAGDHRRHVQHVALPHHGAGGSLFGAVPALPRVFAVLVDPPLEAARQAAPVLRDPRRRQHQDDEAERRADEHGEREAGHREATVLVEHASHRRPDDEANARKHLLRRERVGEVLLGGAHEHGERRYAHVRACDALQQPREDAHGGAP